MIIIEGLQTQIWNYIIYWTCTHANVVPILQEHDKGKKLYNNPTNFYSW